MQREALLLALLHEATTALQHGLGVEWLHDESGHLLGFQVTFLSDEAVARARGESGGSERPTGTS